MRINVDEAAEPHQTSLGRTNGRREVVYLRRDGALHAILIPEPVGLLLFK